jgi:hypothetical protein
MPFPTVRTLRELESLDSVAALASWASARHERGIEKIRPAMATVDGKTRILVPGDPGYEAADEQWQAN